MDGDTARRVTIGIVDKVDPTGEVFVHEERSRKLGFLSNTTPVVGMVRLRRGV
jgi:hypothetical protein